MENNLYPKNSTQHLFEFTEENRIKIEYDYNWIYNHIPFLDSIVYDNIYATFSLEELILAYEMEKEITSENAEEVIIEEFTFSNSCFVNKNLFSSVVEFLSNEKGEFNSIFVGTLCKALMVIVEYLSHCEKVVKDDDYELKKSNCIKNVAFIKFLEEYNKDTKDIKKIMIQEKTEYNTTSSVEFPVELFEILLSSFINRINKNTNLDANEFLTICKKDCEKFVEAFPTKTIMINNLIRKIADGLNELLKTEFEIQIPNKRHIIIGRLFALIGIPDNVQELNTKVKRGLVKYGSLDEYCAGIARDYIRQSKK